MDERIIIPTGEDIKLYGSKKALPLKVRVELFEHNNHVSVSIKNLEKKSKLEIGYIWTKGSFSRGKKVGDARLIIAPRAISYNRLPRRVMEVLGGGHPGTGDTYAEQGYFDVDFAVIGSQNYLVELSLEIDNPSRLKGRLGLILDCLALPKVSK